MWIQGQVMEHIILVKTKGKGSVGKRKVARELYYAIRPTSF